MNSMISALDTTPQNIAASRQIAKIERREKEMAARKELEEKERARAREVWERDRQRLARRQKEQEEREAAHRCWRGVAVGGGFWVDRRARERLSRRGQ